MKRRLSRVKRFELLDDVLSRHVRAVVVREEVERRGVACFPFEQNTEVRVTDVAEHEARHDRGILARTLEPFG
jgi:hypothetical protein